MWSLLEKLGFSRPDSAAGDGDEAVDLIAERLEGLDPERARYLALLAMVLARAARADLEISDDERWMMQQILREHAEVPDEQAALLLDMVVHRSRVFGIADDYVATRELRAALSDAHRRCMLRCLFAVCAADDSISLVEEEEVRQVASELGFEHDEYVAARTEFRAKREVLRGLDRRPPED